MKLYNTLTRKLELFKPIKPRLVTFYHCGPTVYWTQHIGNLQGMTRADLIRRSLIYLGYKVKFIRNYTDVGHLISDQDEGEDKMEKGAKREGLSPKQIADKYIKIFENDINKLNILDPDHKPRATEYIQEIIEMIKVLLKNKHAYITDLAIYFDVSTFKNYNQLNRQKINLNKPGLGKGKIEDPQKKHFADFSLWFFKRGIHKNALQTWPSPWGEGFPGWHIECSVMTRTLLGDSIDIHMGGVEHIPIHHTNEIAQSESANGIKFVNYWLHNEHLLVNEKKMAKSEGTGYSLQEIINHGFDPIDLRYFFLNAHYRSQQNFTWEALTAARESLNNLKGFVIVLKKQTQRTALSPEKLEKINEFKRRFEQAISNDFQIPQALAITWEMAKSNLPSTDKLDLLYNFDQVFGLRLNEIQEEKIPQLIIDLGEKRQQYRNDGDFEKADQLRQKIENLGYKVEDSNRGYRLKK